MYQERSGEKEIRARFFDEEECPSFIVVLYLLLSAGERERTNHETDDHHAGLR
jgi:hypothetical protein